MVTPRDIAWLAGLLEGEGSFLLHRHTNGTRRPKVVVNMTDKDIVMRAAKLLGGSITRTPGRKRHWKMQYRTAVEGARAVGWMMTLYQFLGQRRQAKIRDVLDYWKAGGQVRPSNLQAIWKWA